MPSLARSVQKPQKVPSLARSVHNPLKVPTVKTATIRRHLTIRPSHLPDTFVDETGHLTIRHVILWSY